MARIRSIKPGFFLSDELAELPPLDRILFAGLWVLADREGRLEDRIKKIKAEILPYDDHDVDEALLRLADKNFIQRYEIKGCKYIQILNFLKHQCPNIKEHPSIIPAPYKNNTSTPRLRKGKEGNSIGKERKETKTCVSENSFPKKQDFNLQLATGSETSHSEAVALDCGPLPTKGPSDSIKAFAEFKAAYPKQNGKFLEEKETFRRFCLIPEDDRPLVILAAKNYAESERIKKGIGVKDPKNFIGEELPGRERPYWREWIEPEKKKEDPDPNACIKCNNTDWRTLTGGICDVCENETEQKRIALCDGG